MMTRKVFHLKRLDLECIKPGGWPGFVLLLIKAYQGCQGSVVEILGRDGFRTRTRAYACCCRNSQEKS